MSFVNQHSLPISPAVQHRANNLIICEAAQVVVNRPLVVVGDTNLISTSMDNGVTWTTQTIAGAGSFGAVVDSGTAFVAITSNVTKSYTSPTGAVWAAGGAPGLTGTVFAQNLAYGGGRNVFVLPTVAEAINSSISNSATGVAWAAQLLMFKKNVPFFNAGRWILGCITTGAANTTVLYSDDFVTWTPGNMVFNPGVTVAEMQALGTVNFNGTLFMTGASLNGFTQRMNYSNDNGATWTAIDGGDPDFPNPALVPPICLGGFKSGNGVMVTVVGFNGVPRGVMRVCSDGVNWAQILTPVPTSGGSTWANGSLLFKNGAFWALTTSGDVFKSVDGLVWVQMAQLANPGNWKAIG